jgi:hypothetical protein
MTESTSGELDLQPSKLQIGAMDFAPINFAGLPDPRSDLAFSADGMFDFGIPEITSNPAGPALAGPQIPLSCPFGMVYRDDEGDWYLLGGYVYCGDKNFYVTDLALDKTSTGQYLISIKLGGITANTDDDDAIILPGVKTSTSTPVWHSKPYTTGTNFDNNTNFTSPTSIGQIVIPVGKVVIVDNTVSLDWSNCGNLTVSQCAGILSFTRA